MPVNSSVGWKKEAAGYGVAQSPVVEKWLPYMDLPQLKPDMNRLEAEVQYYGATIAFANAGVPIYRGSGDASLVLPITNKGIGFFLEMGFGAVGTAGPADITNEVQRITVTVGSGTFTVTYSGQTTAAIAFNATAAAVMAALEALSNIAPGDITVTGNPGGPYTVTFGGGTFAGTDVAAMTASNAAIATLQAGAVTGVYTHTFTLSSSLVGKSFALQTNDPYRSNVDQAFTYLGGKVLSLEIAATLGEVATLTAALDFQSETPATALVTPSIPAGIEPMSWAASGSYLSFEGVVVPITQFNIAINNQLRIRDARFGSGLQREPVFEAYREITYSYLCDWESLAFYNYLTATTNAGTYGQVVCALQAPSLIGGTARPSLTVTVPAARVDAADRDRGGLTPIMQTISGVGRNNLSAAPITAVYVTTDATVS